MASKVCVFWLQVFFPIFTILGAFQCWHPTHSISLLFTKLITTNIYMDTVACTPKGTNMTKMYSKSPIVYISGIQDIIHSHSTFLLDMYGVLHDGNKPYPDVLQAIRELKRYNKKIIIVSNSSKETHHSKQSLLKLGFQPEEFYKVVTSGEVTHRILFNDSTLPFPQWNIMKNLHKLKCKKIFILGGENGDDIKYCESCGWEPSCLEDADLILAKGVYSIYMNSATILYKRVNEEFYSRKLNKSLQIAAKRKIPMIVANPDKVAPMKGLPPMPGAIADTYQKILNDAGVELELIKHVGKPFQEVYQVALENCDEKWTVMVGDTLETDVNGRKQAECHTLWVTMDGVHAYDINDISDKKLGSYEKGVESVLNMYNKNWNNYWGSNCPLIPTFCIKHFKR